MTRLLKLRDGVTEEVEIIEEINATQVIVRLKRTGKPMQVPRHAIETEAEKRRGRSRRTL